MPLVFAQSWTRACEAYVVPILVAAGASSPRLTWQPPQPDGEKHGVPLVEAAFPGRVTRDVTGRLISVDPVGCPTTAAQKDCKQVYRFFRCHFLEMEIE